MVDHDTQTVIDQLDLVSFPCLHDQLYINSLTLPAETVQTSLCNRDKATAQAPSMFPPMGSDLPLSVKHFRIRRIFPQIVRNIRNTS